MQNDRQWCKIIVRRFVFNILWHFEVMEEKPKVLVGLTLNAYVSVEHGCSRRQFHNYYKDEVKR